MAWFDRPEGFITKSFDCAAPSVTIRNDIIAAAVPVPPCDCDLCIEVSEGVHDWTPAEANLDHEEAHA